MPEPIDAQPSAPIAILQKSANPGPLGLAGFGLTTVVLSAINAGLLPHEAVPVVVPLAFAYGGVAQIIAGILEFRTGNTFGMVAFTSYGLFWWWFALLQWTVGAGWLKAPPPAAGGTVLLMWGIFTFLLWIVTFRLSKAVWSIFLLLWITFFFLACGRLRLLHRLHLAAAASAATSACLPDSTPLLVAFIEVLNATANRTVIPVGKPFITN